MYQDFKPFYSAGYYFIAWICHILCIHLLVDKHLDCFNFLAIMNFEAELFVWMFSIFLDTSLRVEFLCPVVIVLTFGTLTNFFTVAVPFY